MKKTLTAGMAFGGLLFRRSLLPGMGIFLAVLAGQWGSFWRILEWMKEQGYSLTADTVEDGRTVTQSIPWAPRLEDFLAGSHWRWFFLGGLLLMMVMLAVLPPLLSRGSRAAATCWRLPARREVLLAGGLWWSFCWMLLYWIWELVSLTGCWMLYRQLVPVDLQMDNALVMALVRYSFLDGIFPLTRPALLPLVLLQLMLLGAMGAMAGLWLMVPGCTGWLILPLSSVLLFSVLEELSIRPAYSWPAPTLILCVAVWFGWMLRGRLKEDPMTGSREDSWQEEGGH